MQLVTLHWLVIPAKAGIQRLDSRLKHSGMTVARGGNDKKLACFCED